MYNKASKDGGENLEEHKKVVTEVQTQDNIVEIELNIDSDVDGGINIDRDRITGHLNFIQVPSYQVESSLSDVDMTKELLQRICSVNLRLYRQEVSGMPINNDTELQQIIASSALKRNKANVKKQLIREYEIVDGFPVLDEYEHLNEAPSI